MKLYALSSLLRGRRDVYDKYEIKPGTLVHVKEYNDSSTSDSMKGSKERLATALGELDGSLWFQLCGETGACHWSAARKTLADFAQVGVKPVVFPWSDQRAPGAVVSQPKNKRTLTLEVQHRYIASIDTFSLLAQPCLQDFCFSSMVDVHAPEVSGVLSQLQVKIVACSSSVVD